MPRKSSGDYAILGLLAIGPMSGYDIRKFVQEVLSSFWNESYGRIYPLLAELTRQGLARKRLERRTGKPDRHVYQITNRGRATLQAWLRLPPQPIQIRNEATLKLLFGANLSIQENLRAIERVRDGLLREKAALVEFEEAQAREKDESDQWEYFALVLRLGQVLNQARLRWCDEASERLERRSRRRTRKEA